MQNKDSIVKLFMKRHSNLSDIETNFWYFYFIENIKQYQLLSQEIDTDIDEIRHIFNKLKHDKLFNDGSIIDYYNNLYSRFAYNEAREEGFKGFENFIIWHLNQPLKCCYCGIEENDLKNYFNEKNPQYYIDKDNKARQRGRCLEIEVVKTKDKKKDNIYSESNCKLSCYICNNAKSDFLSAKSFKPIAEGISKFWNGILNNDNTKALDTFDNNNPIWQKD